MKTAQDRNPKQATKAELEAFQKQQQEEESKQKEFIEKYNALCDEYSYNIVPQIGVQLQKISPRTNGVK